MTTLRNRVWRLRIDTIESTELAFSASVERVLNKPAAKLSMIVRNLSEDHRNRLAELSTYRARDGSNVRVEIEAGYHPPGGVSTRTLIARMDVRYAASRKNGPTWETALEGEDGGSRVLAARVARTYGAGTPALTVVTDCVTALGLGPGNLSDYADVLAARSYASGTMLTGSTSRELTGILRSARLTWTTEHGAVRIHGPGANTLAVRLTPDTGLQGSPCRNPDGTVACESRLVPEIRIGGRVVLEAASVSGTFEVSKLKAILDTHGDDWGYQMELRNPR